MEIPPTGIPKLPNREQIREALKELKAKKWGNLDTKEKIDAAIPWPLKAMYMYSLPWFIEAPIYRVRESKTFPANTDTDNIYRKQSFSYPPENKSQGGRCNHAGYSVFYGSSNATLAIVEACKKLTGNDCYIGRWTIPSGREIKVRPFISNIPEEIKKDRDYIFCRLEEAKRKRLEGLPEKHNRIFELIDRIHEQNFTQFGSKRHKYSAWLSHKALEYHRIRQRVPNECIPDALIFQNTIHHSLGTNLAIHKNFADSMLLEKAFHVNIILNKGDIVRQLSRIGACEDKKIIWKEPTENDWEEFKKACPMHSSWITRLSTLDLL